MGKYELTFTINGAPITKKNHQEIRKNWKTGKHFIGQSKQYERFEQEALWQIPQLAEPIDMPVNVKCLFFMPTHRRVDQVNLLEAICDILVAGKILQDDNARIICSHDGTRVYYDKENPRTEVTITPFWEETEYESV